MRSKQLPYLGVFWALILGFSLWNLQVIGNYLEATNETGIGWSAYMMAVLVGYGALLIAVMALVKNELPGILAVMLGFGGAAALSTAVSGLYSLTRLGFRMVEIFFWICAFAISYYAAPRFRSLKWPVYAVYIIAMAFAVSFVGTVIRLKGNNMLLLNPVYYILFCLPFLLLVRWPVLRYFGILVVFACVILSFKRTAMLCFFLVVVYYLYMENKNLKNKLAVRLLFYLFILVCVVAGVYLFLILSQRFNLNWGKRMEALLYDGGSNRADIWQGIFQALGEQDWLHWLVGHGHRATGILGLGGAHNDFLEILYDYGLAGLGLYIWFVALLVRLYFRMRRQKYAYTSAFGVSLIIFFVCSMTSQLVIHPYWFVYLPIFWGLLYGDFAGKREPESPGAGKNSRYIRTLGKSKAEITKKSKYIKY